MGQMAMMQSAAPAIAHGADPIGERTFHTECPTTGAHVRVTLATPTDNYGRPVYGENVAVAICPDDYRELFNPVWVGWIKADEHFAYHLHRELLSAELDDRLLSWEIGA